MVCQSICYVHFATMFISSPGTLDNAELIDVFSQNLVHSSLKGTGCIGQAEGEYVPFVMTISRGERCLSTRKQAENDLPVTRAQVDAREVLHTKESKEGLVDSG